MKKHKWIWILAVVTVYVTIYFITTVYHWDALGNILSPIGTLLSFSLLLTSCFKSSESRVTKIIWMMYGMAGIVWTGGKIMQFLHAFIGAAAAVFYPLANLFILAAVLIFGFERLKTWNGIQLLVDSLAIIASSFLMLWILFFNKDMLLIQSIFRDGWLTTLGITADLLMIVSIGIYSLGIHYRLIPGFVKIIALGTALFAITDLYHYYLYLNQKYNPHSFYDVFYIAAFLIIGIGSRMQSVIQNKEPVADNIGIQIDGRRFRSHLIAAYPVFVILMKGFVLTDILYFCIIIVIHTACSSYVRTAVKNEYLLRKEKELNLALEEQVKQRTSELEEINKELDFLSNQDTVTNLYNRRYFIRALEEKLEHTTLYNNVAVLFIDLDHFKTINDTYGHDIGDQVLIEFSNRLKKWADSDATVARLGGDEFVVAIGGEFGYRQIEKMAQNMIAQCTKEIEIKEYVFHTTISVGISLYPLDALDTNMMMKNADIAMYQAKAQGRDQCVSFTKMLNDNNNRKNHLEILLRKANYDKEFTLYYQPQFHLPNLNLTGMEALLRWNPPGGEAVLPAEFIPIAEEMDHIVFIGRWVMKEAIRQIACWNASYRSQLKMGFNVSPKQLDNKNFFSELSEEIEKNGIDPKWIDIEVTENIAIQGQCRIHEVAAILNNMGVPLSIDDFGTGYSSLSDLKTFHFDCIKIAKPLIDAISEHGYDLQIVKSIISLAKSIGIKTIAEGVEYQKQLDILTDLKCEEIQGFLLGKPIPAADFEKIYLARLTEPFN